MVTQDILSIGDVWAADLSPLELQNADTKRTACSACGSRRLTTSEAGQTKARGGGAKAGQVVPRKPIDTSMSISTLKTRLATRALQAGDGIGDYHLPASRRTSRLFGDAGRTKGQRSGVKIVKIDADYDPTTDTCVRAFVRLMAQHAQEVAAAPAATS